MRLRPYVPPYPRVVRVHVRVDPGKALRAAVLESEADHADELMQQTGLQHERTAGVPVTRVLPCFPACADLVTSHGYRWLKLPRAEGVLAVLRNTSKRNTALVSHFAYRVTALTILISSIS